MCRKYHDYDLKAWNMLLKSMKQENHKKYDVQKIGKWNNTSVRKKIRKLHDQYVQAYTICNAFAHCNHIHFDMNQTATQDLIVVTYKQTCVEIMKLLITSSFFSDSDKNQLNQIYSDAIL